MTLDTFLADVKAREARGRLLRQSGVFDDPNADGAIVLASVERFVEIVERARKGLACCSDGTCRRLYGDAAQPQQGYCRNCQTLADLDSIAARGGEK